MDQRHGMPQELGAGRILPFRVGVGKMSADVPETGRAEHGIRDRMTDHIRIGMAERAAIARHVDATEHEPPAFDEPVKIVASANPPPDRLA